MQHKTRPGRMHRITASCRTALAWAAARRRPALALALRGACYGAGTGAAGLVTFWLEHRL